MRYEARDCFGDKFWMDFTLLKCSPRPYKDLTSYGRGGWFVELKGYDNDDPDKYRFYRREHFKTKREAQAFLSLLKKELPAP